MMASYSSHCKICDGKFVGKENWTGHLFQEDHQKKARLEWGNWEETRKECALTANFSSPIIEDNGEGTSNLVVLLWKYLKRIVDGVGVLEEDSSLLIADFIWWKEKPTMAIILFETREMADQLYTETMNVGNVTGGCDPIKIGNYYVEFKKLVGVPPETECKIQVPDLDSNQDYQSPPLQASTSLGSPPNKKLKISPDDLADATKNYDQPSSVPMPTIVTQFNAILKSVEIPLSEVEQTKQIIEQVKTLISSDSRYPSCEVYSFRNNYLKIRNPFCNDLLIFAHGGPTSTSPGFQKLDINNVARFAVINAPTLFWLVYGEEPKYKGCQLFQLANSPTGSGSPFYFWLLTDEGYLLEVQLNRLLEYMVSFDPKCSLLLSLTHYFCAINSCYFGDLPSKCEAIEWLLIFFLSKEKKIPTVRQILDQPHQPITFSFCGRNYDIGFNPDPDFAMKWRTPRNTHKEKAFTHDYVCDVLRLFQGFLRFVGRIIPSGNFILNVKDAETQNRKQVVFQPVGKWTTKLSGVEIDIIKSNPLYAGQTNKWPFFIVHPLAVHLNLGYDIDEFEVASKVMKRGVFHLNRFLNLNTKEVYVERWVRKKGDLPENYNDLENVLKIEDAPQVAPKKEKKKWNHGRNQNY